MSDKSHASTEPIFIMGHLHSGSTLLQGILGRHPQIFRAAGETRFFWHLSVIKGEFPDLQDDQTLRDYLAYLVALILTGYSQLNYHGSRAHMSDILAENGIDQSKLDTLYTEASSQRQHEAIFIMTYDFLARDAGKSRWLDKHPGMTAQFPQIHQAVPAGRVIEVLRDPRDILASKKRRQKTGGYYDPYWDTLSWKSDVRGARLIQKQYPQHILPVRYEDLVSKPESALRRICEFVDLVYCEDMLRVGWVNSTTAAESAAGKRDISTAAIGKWRKDLSLSEVLIAQRVGAQEMALHGYELIEVRASQYPAAGALMVRSSGEFFTRLYKRWQRAGLSGVKNDLEGYRLRLRANRQRQ